MTNTVRNLWILYFLLLTYAPAVAQQTTNDKSKPRAKRPNILLILTDDQGWSTLGCYGGKIVPTPHLDRLAAEGARFTDAYVTSQCTPTRATLLTGQYTARSKLWHVIGWYGYPYARMTEPPFSEGLSRNTFTIADGLRAVGYKTAIIGKWHLTTNEDGHYLGLNPKASQHYGFDYAPPILSRKEFQPGHDRGVKTMTDQALQFIKKHRNQPWFCYLSHHMIHGKVVAPKSITKKYEKKGYGEKGPNRAVYLAGLECIDRSIGRLMKGLEDLGEANDTIVIFMSDNGGIDERLDFKNLPMPLRMLIVFGIDIREYDNAPLRGGKGSCYEGGIRIPFIVCWPGHIPKGQVINTPIHAIDILPTCFQIAGAKAPQKHIIDGRDLSRLMKTGKDNSLTNRPLYQYTPFYDLRWGLTPSASIRVGDYKLIEFFGDRVDTKRRYIRGHQIELYNLRNDVGETKNLAAKEPKRAKAFRRQLRAWMKKLDAPTPQLNKHYDPKRPFFETRKKPAWIRGQ